MKRIKTIFLFLSTLLMCLHLLASVSLDGGIDHGFGTEKPSPEKPATNVSQSDTLSPEQNLLRRLEDPTFDIRINNTPMPPWHDIKSTYPRRTIPSFNLADIREIDIA